MGSAARYERLDQIGSGTFGHAWLVRSRASGRQYVVKEVKVTSLLEHEREQSVNEVAILSQCKHVNIIRYKEAFIEHTSGSLNIVMEYADGGDLYARIVNQRAADDHFPEELVLNWFIQITFAVQYLHSKNILHRDLKTQNIFLTSDNLVKVGDFGIARTLRSTQELATTAIGTPYYLSPEICQRQPYNHKSDQWAVGCIVYEMCCLTHPFNANSFENLVLKILQARYTPIPSRYSLLLRDLVTVLLRTQPDRRPSAEQVLMIPALKPYVDSYVQWQNAVLSPRTDQRTSGSSNGSSNDSNGSDTTDIDSLMLSRDDTGASTMTADSLEPVTSAESVSESAAEPPAGPAGPAGSYAPAREAPLRKSGRRSAEVPTWRSKYAGDLADQGAQRSDADSERPERDRERPDRDAERPRRSSERRERGSHGGPEPGRRRSLQNGGVSATARCGDEDVARAEDRVMAVRDAPTAPVEAHSCLPAVALAGAEDEGPSHTPSCGGVARPRSCSLSSLSPTEPKVDDSASKRLLTPDSAKLRSRPSSGRGPSALIRQVLKKKFSRHEARPRSASDPSEQSPLEVRAAGSRDRSPARVFRRPSLSLARFSTPEPPSPGRLARRADAKPVVRSRPQSAVIARPVGRPPACRRDRSVGSSSSVGSDGSVSKKSEQQPYWSHCSEQQHQHQHHQQQCRSDSRQETVPTPHPTAAAGSEAGQHKLDSAGHSSPDRAGDTDDSDGQEKTLVNAPPQLPDINHNSLEPGGGPRHASECHSSACCSLICAQCRYDSDERLARLAWAGRVNSGRRADQAALLHHLGQTLGEERLKSALDLLHHHWDAEEVSWMEELVFVLGRQHVYLLPLMVQAVQLGGQTG